MKRVLALALALVLSLSVGVIAFAADEYDFVLAGSKDDGLYYHVAPNSTTNIVVDVYADANGDGKLTADELLLDAISAGKALDDNYLKVSFKATKGSEYIKSYEFKKSGTKQLFLEVKTVELYLGKVYDIAFEVKVTFTKPSKIAEKLVLANTEKNGYVVSTAAVTLQKEYFGVYTPKTATVAAKYEAGKLKNNDYLINETNNWRFGWSKEYEIGATSFKNYLDVKIDVPTDFTYTPDPGFKSMNQDKTYDVNWIHIKKGTGDTSTLDFDSAYVEVKFSDQAAINMYYSEAAVKAITSKFADVDFQFWDWRGKPALDFTASVELYVDEDLVGEDSILYFWDGTSLTKVNADYNDATFIFRTRQLGTYVAASKEVSITAAPVETTAAAGEEAGATTAAGTGNPHTGVSDFVGVAVALAVVSMAAAGAVALKK